ncbi:hypothetical protein HR17_01655 [Porphyromonas gulae]|nr:hypothetical protein HQ50_05235 [Porphyromonas sp. COT-052 OH4946]KGN76648.1 hypothetical protein HR17_01655 [Porphyromonas gulae]KGO04045.1 hypothetical protein HR16_07805 [Porphyromonas gulae]
MQEAMFYNLALGYLRTKIFPLIRSEKRGARKFSFRMETKKFSRHVFTNDNRADFGTETAM